MTEFCCGRKVSLLDDRGEADMGARDEPWSRDWPASYREDGIEGPANDMAVLVVLVVSVKVAAVAV